MDYCKTLQKRLKATPSIEERIGSYTDVHAIVTPGTKQTTFFEKQPKHIFQYNKGVLREGNKMYSFADLQKLCGPNDMFVISHLQAREIALNLKRICLENIMDVTHYNWRNAKMLDTGLIEENLDKINQVFSIIDAESQKMLFQLLLFRILLDPSLISQSEYQQYFHPSFPKLNKDIIIDGGAFIGDSAFPFFSQSDFEAEIFSFEPDLNNFSQLFKNIRDSQVGHLIHALPFGIWDSYSLKRFDSDDQSSRLTEDGDRGIITIDIDSFCTQQQITPTVIKLDVEGAEIEALNGARKTIKDNKPRMCVSLYHEGSHLWDIPLLLKSIREDYTFSIGHHPQDLTIYETVLYAQ